MAFNINDDKEHSEKVKEGLKTTNKHISSDGTLNIPKKEPIEKKKTYTFSLLPSVRKNIEKMAEENNYDSSSELLNTIFKQ